MPGTAIDTIWVCDCCLFAREGDGDGCHGDGTCGGEPWSIIPDRQTVTLGMFAHQHECGRSETTVPAGYECECERRAFSWRRCEGCGSMQGGARQAYTLWQE